MLPAPTTIAEIARPGSRWSKATMRRIRIRFHEMKRRNGGMLTAEMIVNDARDPRSPLHRHFEWNDGLAAEKWRLEQARGLLRAVYVVVKLPTQEATVSVRALVVVQDGGRRGYVSTVEAMERPEYSDQVLLDAQMEMRAWITRYGRFEQLRCAVDAARMALQVLDGPPAG